MQGDDPTGDRPGGPAPTAPGADAVLAALAHRLRARSERQQLLTERLRSGELRPGALADLAELAAAARRGIRDGDHILVMAGAPAPERGGGGSTPLGQALSSAVSASEAASRTVVPPTPSVSLTASAAPVFGQILAELLAHASAATSPGERLELHTRWGPDGGLVVELLSPRPVPTRMPVDELDRMLAAGRPDGPVAPQEIGLFLAARLARALGGRLGVRGAPGTGSVSGPAPVAVLQLPPAAFGGSGPVGEGGDGRRIGSAAAPGSEMYDAPGPAYASGPAGDEPTGTVPAGGAPAGMAAVAGDPGPSHAAPDVDHGYPIGDAGPRGGVPDVARGPGPESSAPPWPPLPVAGAWPSNGSAPNGSAPDGPPSREDGAPGSGPVRLPVPPAPGHPFASGPFAGHPANGAPPSGPGARWLPPAFAGPADGGSSSAPGRPGADDAGDRAVAGPDNGSGSVPSDVDRSRPWRVNGDRPGHAPVAGEQFGAPRPGPGRGDPAGSGPAGADRPGPGRPATEPANGSAPAPVEFSPVTEALPVPGTTPPVELFGPFDSEVPVPIDDLDGTPIFAAVASAWFREPTTPPGGAPAGEHPPGRNGHRADEGPANWRTGGDPEFEAARTRADRVVQAPVNANGLPMRRPGQQMVPPSRRDSPAPASRPRTAERQPDRVRNRLASYQRGLREGRHRAAEENASSTGDGAAPGVNGAHGTNGQATG